MALKRIDRSKCEQCELAKEKQCPLMKSCHADVIRIDDSGYPYAAYPTECDSCFMCEMDCPHQAVEVSAKIHLPFIERW